MAELFSMCPVCITKCGNETTVCKVCGFSDDLGIVAYWLNEEDANDWFETAIKPRRTDWELRELRRQNEEILALVKKQQKELKNLQTKLKELESNFSIKLQKPKIAGMPDKNAKYIKTAVMESVNAFSTISVGEYHTMAIKDDGSLWAWGYNYYGQLGDGTREDRRTPVKIMDGVAQVSAGHYHTMAIKSDGSLWAWGYNRLGQLGDGTREDRRTPVKIMGGVAQVSTGNGHTAAIKSDGSLWAWGYNEYGRLGDGTTEDRRTPVEIMDGVMVKEIKHGRI